MSFPFGDLISGAASLIGGLMGNHQENKQFGESVRQFNEQMDFQKNATQYRVQDALKAGINPLAALGVSANVSPTISAQGNNSGGRGIAGLGRAIRDAFRSKAEDEKEGRALDLEAKRIENEIQRTKLLSMTQPGIIGNEPETVGIKPDGRKMLYDVAYDLQGRPRLMVNQDVTENDTDNAGYRSALATAFASGQINPFTGRVRSRQLQMLIDDMYYQSTGRHITNLDELYISPTEVGFAAADELQGWLPSKGKK